MRSIALCFLTVLLANPFATFAADQSYEFSTDTFQLGRWNPKSLSYEQGLRKLEVIDQWYQSLPLAEREKQLDNYTLNRNRLFLVTQEKRLRSEIDAQTALTGLTESGKAIRKERSVDLRTLQKMSESLLDDPKRITGLLLREMNDIVAVVNPEVAGAARASGSAFMTNISKSNGGGSGGYQGFGEMVSLLGPRSTNNALDYNLERILPANCRSDKECRAAKARIKAKIEKERAEADEQARLSAELDAKFKAEAEKYKKSAILEQQVCSSSNNYDYPLEREFSNQFSPKTGKFLKELGISQTGDSRKSNDLSNWFGEPTTQYDSKGYKQATCIGHAIANNVAGALARKKTLRLGRLTAASLSPEVTHAIAKYHEGRAASPHEGRPNPSLAGYCDLKKYDADTFEGIENTKRTLEKMTLVPLCAKSTAEATTDLYQIKKFESVEFGPIDKPGFQAFKAMIDSGHTPIVHVDTETRTESAGWFQFKRSSEDLEHVLTIVGYEEAIDPWTLCKTKVFIVRDSMGKRKVHYRVPADNLIKHLKGIYQVTQVEAVKPGSSPNGNDRGPVGTSPIAR